MNAVHGLAPGEAHRLIAERIAPARPKRVSLGRTLLRLGLLDEQGVSRVVAAQKKTRAPFGRTAVRLGLLTYEQLYYGLGVQLGLLHETTEAVTIPPALVVVRNPYSQHAEDFRALRTHLATGAADKLSVFAVTGADERVDADYVAANLAAAFAQLGRRTLLMDADFRRPRLSGLLHAEAEPGIIDALLGEAPFERAVEPTIVKNFDLMTAGLPSQDPQPLLSSKSFKAALQQAQSAYDIVIVLTSPFGKTADCEFVWSATERALVAARKNVSNAMSLARMKTALRHVGAETLGAAVIR